MGKLIRFFLDNTHLNHILLVFLIISGVYAYIKIPKELFPDMALNKIVISGSYPGASANNLDKMAVRDIEDDVSAVSGVGKIESVITPGRFSVIITLDEDAHEIDVLNRVKDAIANIGRNLPADMNMPVARSLVKMRYFIKLSVSSEKLDFDELLEQAKDIRSRLLKVAHISQVDIYGDSDKKVEIKLDALALRAYHLNPSDVISVIKNLSYTFPIGDIDDEKQFVFVSTVNGKETVEEWENSLLKIGDRSIYLKDIATVSIHHPHDRTMASFNGQKSITLSVYKDMEGDLIVMANEMYDRIDHFNKLYEKVDIAIFQDGSKPVKNRLNIIISSLTLGLILIFFTMYYLINRNIAIVVSIGIPFAFIIGLLFIYFMGYSLNLISLVGALLVVGLAVDDAVIVSENIQRHIDEGMDAYEAAFTGTKEVFLPILLATATTMAAFLPMFMMTGEMGLFIKLIPVVVIMVLLGSLVESFLFLPLHAKEILKRESPSLDWSWMTNRYEKILHKLLHYKKTTLIVFFVGVPLLTFAVLKMLSFQFFPTFDTDKIYITGKLKINTRLQQSYDIAHKIELDILKRKKELSVKTVSTLSGKRKSLGQDWETASNMFYLTIELEDRTEQNFVEKYINPVLNLSFDFNDPRKVRSLSSFEIADRLRSLIEPYRSRYDFMEFAVMERKIGMIKTDIELNLIGTDSQKIEKAVKKIEARLHENPYVNEIVDNIRYGKMEYKIRINGYGEELGLTEGYVASILSGYFLGGRKAMTFDDDGVVEITTEFKEKDRLSRLLNFDVPLGDGRFVALNDVAEFIIMQDYEKIEKDNGYIVKTVSANVDKTRTTSGQVFDGLKETLDTIGNSGIDIKIGGEKEKNQQLKDDMIQAVVVAMFLMLILLLLIFPKIKYALMILSVIPASIVGALIGHLLMGMNIGMTSIIGMLGLAGVVINDGIIMLDFLHGTHDTKSFYRRAKQRLRPIVITTVTTFIGLSTLMFFATGQAKIMQPLSISLGFGLLWGTIINLLYLPTLYAFVNRISPEKKSEVDIQNFAKAAEV
ncbi:MAG: resistance-nodulation-cell division family transporter [Helicobacteraceae bacterium 4484_230]|nr:MAG: resistance-nodulation-cell division family transporter [Helicobacteraceae bacterium 4484_230]